MMYRSTIDKGNELNTVLRELDGSVDGVQQYGSLRKRPTMEIVRGTRASMGRTPAEVATAAQALEMMGRISRTDRVTAARTALAYGEYESEFKLEIACDRLLDDLL
jgi:hypothetical protein